MRRVSILYGYFCSNRANAWACRSPLATKAVVSGNVQRVTVRTSRTKLDSCSFNFEALSTVFVDCSAYLMFAFWSTTKIGTAGEFKELIFWSAGKICLMKFCLNPCQIGRETSDIWQPHILHVCGYLHFEWVRRLFKRLLIYACSNTSDVNYRYGVSKAENKDGKVLLAVK